ncbi:MAG: transcriptional repressor [Verrucomicrobiota bacterium]
MERRTRQQDAIEEVLRNSGRPLTPAEILQLAQQKVSNIGIATVYRGLKKLIQSNKASLVNIGGAPPHYESTNLPHHHHFVCRICQKVYDLNNCAHGVEKIAPKNFKVDSHEITLYGTCDLCH